MASDISNNQGAGEGQEKRHKVTVYTGGSVKTAQTANSVFKSYDGDNYTESDIADVSGKYDTRFDDPTYYG